MSWTPGRMEQERALQTPRPGMPLDLVPALVGWLDTTFRYDGELFFRTILWLQMPFGDPRGSGNARAAAMARLLDWFKNDYTRVLDVIHHVLVEGSDAANLEALDEILEHSNSLYRVSDDGLGLEERLALGVVEQVRHTVQQAETGTSTHLIDAWNAAYGYDKNYKHAYEEAIRAAETALRPIVSPSSAGASLFKMIKDVAAKPTKWQFVLGDERPRVPSDAPAADGVEVVLDLMRLLAYGQKSRHGGAATSAADEAKAAVLVSVMLVQVCESGAFSLA